MSIIHVMSRESVSIVWKQPGKYFEMLEYKFTGEYIVLTQDHAGPDTDRPAVPILLAVSEKDPYFLSVLSFAAT